MERTNRNDDHSPDGDKRKDDYRVSEEDPTDADKGLVWVCSENSEAFVSTTSPA